MKIERAKNSVKSVFWGALNKAVNLLIPFIIRTVLIQKLGEEFLGLNSLFTSIIQVLNLTELGVGSALVFNMYKPIAEDDTSTLSALLAAYKKIYRLIGLIILVLGAALIPVLPFIVKTEELEGTGISLYALYGIYLFNTVISYLSFAYKKSLLTAYQRHDVISNINSIVNVLLYSCQLICLFALPNYYTYALLIPLFTLIDNIIVHFDVKKRFPEVLAATPSQDAINYKEIFSSTRYIIGHKVGAVIIQSADSIVISMFLSLSMVTVYSNYFYIVSALVGIINVGYNAILGGVGNSIITKTKEELYDLFKLLSFILFGVVSFCSSMLFSLYQPFMEIWMGKEFLLPLDTVILFVFYFYVWQIRVVLLIFKDAAGMWRDDFLKPYIGIIINLTLNVLLVNLIGIGGVLIATIIVMACVYAPWENIVLHKTLFERPRQGYVLRQLLYFVITAAVAAIAYLVTGIVPGSGYVGFIIKAAVCVVVTLALICLCTFYLPEFKNALKRVLKAKR